MAAIKTVVYADTDNKFNFVTNKGCEKYFKVTKSGTSANADYTISLPLAKQWSGRLVSFKVMSEDAYNESEDEMGKPQIILNLHNSSLLTSWGVNDWPSESDLPVGCIIKSEKM